MSRWIAVSNGVVDLGQVAQSGDHHVELAITPVIPSEPLAIGGEVAALWRSLVDDGMAEEGLSVEERALVRKFADAGIATDDADDVRRVVEIQLPWFTSFLHELVCALAARVAQQFGARCLVIKGPTLHAQGLRERTHSGDVDLLVEPARVDEFVEAMSAWGWRLRSNPMRDTLLPHSHTLVPQAWGCEIDAHFRIPGIAAQPSEAFEVLWRQTVEQTFAGVRGFTLNPAAHALIQALTLARPAPGGRLQPLHDGAVEVLRRGGTANTLRLAVDLRAHGALQNELRAVFTADEGPAEPPPNDWVWLSQPNPARVYAQVVKATPWRQKPSVLWKVIVSAGQGASAQRRWLARLIRGAGQLFAPRRPPTATGGQHHRSLGQSDNAAQARQPRSRRDRPGRAWPS